MTSRGAQATQGLRGNRGRIDNFAGSGRPQPGRVRVVVARVADPGAGGRGPKPGDARPARRALEPDRRPAWPRPWAHESALAPESAKTLRIRSRGPPGSSRACVARRPCRGGGGRNVPLAGDGVAGGEDPVQPLQLPGPGVLDAVGLAQHRDPCQRLRVAPDRAGRPAGPGRPARSRRR